MTDPDKPLISDGLEAWHRDGDGRDVWSLTFRDGMVHVTLDGCDIQAAVINGHRWIPSDEPIYAGINDIQAHHSHAASDDNIVIETVKDPPSHVAELQERVDELLSFIDHIEDQIATALGYDPATDKYPTLPILFAQIKLENLELKRMIDLEKARLAIKFQEALKKAEDIVSGDQDPLSA